MNKSNLIWGVICLTIAAGLAVANLTLPPGSLTFSVGNRNMPWVPPIVLGILGTILLVNAYRRADEVVEQPQAAKAVDSEKAVDSDKAELNKRLETIFWGLFLIMLGGWTFIPDETIPKGAWSIAVGLLFLGLNAARYFNHIRMSGFTTVLGILSVIGGIASLARSVEVQPVPQPKSSTRVPGWSRRAATRRPNRHSALGSGGRSESGRFSQYSRPCDLSK